MPPTVTAPTASEIYYPECDGKPMAENTLQLDWMFRLIGNLKNLFRDRPDVFAAGNQNWYPVQGHPEIVQAPDAYVVFGRPKGYRGSWKQWLEDDVPMTVVFEVLSPSNTAEEMAGKVLFYEQYGVQECYVFDPDTNELQVYLRGKAALVPTHPGAIFTSPLLGIRFDRTAGEMVVRYPDGRPFLTIEELDVLREAAEQRAEDEAKRAEDEAKRAEDEHKRAEDEAKRANEAIQRAERAERRADRLAELTPRALLGQLTTQEQEELRALLASPQP